MRRSILPGAVGLALFGTFVACSGGSALPDEPTQYETPTSAKPTPQHPNRIHLELGSGVALTDARWPQLRFFTERKGGDVNWVERRNYFLGGSVPEEEHCFTAEIALQQSGNEVHATEIWCPTGERVEHAYKFTSRPATAALKIAMKVEGPPPVLATENGITWRNHDGRALTYGKATWIDAVGRRFPVALAYRDRGPNGGEIELSVAASVLEESEYPAVLDPTLSQWSQVAESVLSPSATQMYHVTTNRLGDDAVTFLQTLDETEMVWVRVRADGTIAAPRPAPFHKYTGTPGAHSTSVGTFFASYALQTDETRAANHFLLASGTWAYRNVPAGYVGNGLGIAATSTGYQVFRRRDPATQSAWFLRQADVLPDGTTTAETNFGAAIGALPNPGSVRKVFSTGPNQYVVITGVSGGLRAHLLDGSNLSETIDLATDFPQGTSLSLVDVANAPDHTIAGIVNHFPDRSVFTLVGNVYTHSTLPERLEHIVYGHSRFLLVGQASASAVWRTFTPGVGLGPLHTTACQGSSWGAAAVASGFAITTRCNNLPVVYMVDPAGVELSPTGATALLYDEQTQQPLTFLPRDATSTWALWRDDRDETNPRIYARAIDKLSAEPVAGTDPTGDLVGNIGATAATHSVSTQTRGAITWTDGQAIRGASVDATGALQPLTFNLSASLQSLARPLIIEDDVALVVREQAPNCPSPPCAGLTLLRSGQPDTPLSMPADWHDIFALYTVSDNQTSWIAAVGRTATTSQLAAYALPDFAAASSAQPTVVGDVMNAFDLAGLTVDETGELVIAWRDTDLPAATLGHFTRVDANGAVDTIDLNLPPANGMVALRGGRGLLLGDTIFDAQGNVNEILPTLTPDVGDVPPWTAGDGTVLLGRARPTDTGQGFDVASLFVGEARGAACTLDDDCGSGACEEGVCCEKKCGVCERCDTGEIGRCEPASNTEDDTCFGGRTCNENSECKPSNGQACSDDAACASGFCVGDVCCDSACEDPCGQCKPGVGICVLTDCGAYACAGGGLCKQECESTVDCAAGFACLADGRCGIPPAAPDTEVEGCGCRLAGHPSEHEKGHWWVLGICLLGLRRRRAPTLQ